MHHRLGRLAAGAALLTLALASPAAAANTFSFGQLQASTVGAKGCGTNTDGEPSIHVSRANDVFLGSERGVGSGSDLWRGLSSVGGSGASGCKLEYRGQPNGAGGVGASGGDIDIAIAPKKNPLGFFNVYVASLNLASVNVATSQDRGTTFSQTPVQGGLPVDDREWIAAFGPATSLLTYHDIATDNIDVLRSDDSGALYTQVSRAIPDTDYKAMDNQHGNIVIDHRNTSGAVAGQFWAYQSFVAPHSSSDSSLDEAFLAVSNDGGSTWTDRAIPCSYEPGTNIAQNFPNVSVAPNGTLWYAWSDGTAIRTAKSGDHGQTWKCSGAVSKGSPEAIFPWLVATSNGVDLVYYGADKTGSDQTWYVDFVQDPASTIGGWGTPTRVTAVHKGEVCEGGISCTGGRQLFDDFGVDTDQSGWAHIAYSHDAPNLGGSGTWTGSAVQTGGTKAGFPN
jgi:hypothetical protein